MNFNNLDFVYKNFKISYQLFWCSVISIVFTALGIYLEIVLPKEYGSSKHPLFCCRKKQHVDSAKLLQSYEKYHKDSSSNKYLEKVTDHNLMEQEKKHEVMIVDNLVK